MKKNAMRFSVTVLAALTLASGGMSPAQADEGHKKSGHDKRNIVVKGDHNQIVIGDENVVGGGNVRSSGHGETEEGGENGGNGENGGVTSPGAPYATVRSNVTYLAERTAPRTSAEEIARFSAGTKVPLSCYVPNGGDVHGNTTWYRVRQEEPFRTGYISAYYTTLTGALSRC
ncbi:SH3 domain-containing protein [Streptomyces sp. WMMB 322]|uniref:SH3 domain-containing protein n=1 Tax=Streptomyces sp. WMMB 322 TaxID=1286821 RepID=UPI0006E3B001|nr:SH3 domain-containing protein [Streptomyces sp. WMMB 322]SCK40094.1 SH3 domain-containing protein [Streptomyces sp. WMMB 322]